MTVDPATAIALLGLVAAFLFPMMSRRDVLTKMVERDQGREEWRQEIARRLKELEDAEREVVPHRVKHLEDEHKAYKDWKHQYADPYILNYKELERRVARIERVLNGKLRGD